MQYFQTSDKKLFYVEDLARNHARSLEDKTVKKVDSTQLKAESTVKKIKQALVNVVGETKLTEAKSTANKTAGKEPSKKETEKEVKDKKATSFSKENLETEVNQDQSKDSETATEQVDTKQPEETKTDK